MNSIAIIKTTSKVFGLYFFVLAASSVRDLITSMIIMMGQAGFYNENFAVAWNWVIPGISNVVLGMVMILKADWIAKKVIGNSAEGMTVNIDKKSMLELTLVVISGLTVLTAFPEIMYKLVHFTYFNDYDETERHLFWSNTNRVNVFYSVFKFAVGLFVLLNARNFAGRLDKIGDRDERLGQ